MTRSQTGTPFHTLNFLDDAPKLHDVEASLRKIFKRILRGADALILPRDLTSGPARNWPDVFQYLSEFVSPDQIDALPGNHDCNEGRLNGASHLADVAR